VLEVRQQADVRIGKRRPRARFQALHRLRYIRTPDDVQPLLHIVLCLNCAPAALPGSLEEGVEIELVKLPAARDRQQFIRHLIGEQPHLRHRAVGVPFAGVLLTANSSFGTLLVGVGPVENLLLDELARGQRLERRAGEIEVGPCRDWQKLSLLLREHREVFVHPLQPGGVFELGLLLGDRLVLALERVPWRYRAKRRSDTRRRPQGPNSPCGAIRSWP
jgi:hypothetical protein